MKLATENILKLDVNNVKNFQVRPISEIKKIAKEHHLVLVDLSMLTAARVPEPIKELISELPEKFRDTNAHTFMALVPEREIYQKNDYAIYNMLLLVRRNETLSKNSEFILLGNSGFIDNKKGLYLIEKTFLGFMLLGAMIFTSGWFLPKGFTFFLTLIGAVTTILAGLLWGDIRESEDTWIITSQKTKLRGLK